MIFIFFLCGFDKEFSFITGQGAGFLIILGSLFCVLNNNIKENFGLILGALNSVQKVFELR